MNRRQFLQKIGIAALATPVAYSFLGSGIWTPPVDIITQSMGYDVISGKWTHVLVQGFTNPEDNGHFRITGTDYAKDTYTLERTDEKLCIGGVSNSWGPPHKRGTIGEKIIVPFHMSKLT